MQPLAFDFESVKPSAQSLFGSVANGPQSTTRRYLTGSPENTKNNASSSPAHSPTQKWQGRVSEIIFAAGASANLTFAMLAHLSHQYKCDISQPESGRWLTWLCPQNIGKNALLQFHFDALGVRIVHPKHNGEVPTLMFKALAAGNSHTVVAHCDGIEAEMAPWLEAAAQQGNSQGLIIRPQQLV